MASQKAATSFGFTPLAGKLSAEGCKQRANHSHEGKTQNERLADDPGGVRGPR